MAENKWATGGGVITPMSGVITLLIAGRGPLCRADFFLHQLQKLHRYNLDKYILLCV